MGETKKPVRGSRYFAPGTKVCLEAPHWDGRVAAIGVPRYANKRIRVVMSLVRLEGFALEKVFDPEVIAALQHPFQTWPYTSMARSELGGGQDVRVPLGRDARPGEGRHGQARAHPLWQG